MPRRHVIEVPGLHHGTQPFPMAVRIDNLLLSSGVHGMDRETGTIPQDPVRQIELMFANIRTVVETAGGTVADVAQVLLTVSDAAYRAIVNEYWAALFPDPGDRPARNTQVRDLGGGMACSAVVTAVLAPAAERAGGERG
ncbi:RidA family protein [Streptomyces sp. NPDC057580]|uniref:RidA family protein n=1 Tax=Streptomyces sp. NPDC057580 TaxID=3346173 RepID=UPI0036973406